MAMVNIEALDSHAGKYDMCQWMHKISMPNQAIYINLGTINIISKIDSGSTELAIVLEPRKLWSWAIPE